MGGSPGGASDRSPLASSPTGTAGRTAHEARDRVSRYAAARRSALAGAAIAPYTRPTPIEIPIPRAVRIAIGRHAQHDVPARHAAHVEPTIVRLREPEADVVVGAVGPAGKGLPAVGKFVLQDAGGDRGTATVGWWHG